MKFYLYPFVFLNKLGVADHFSFVRPGAHCVFRTGLKFIAALAFQVPEHVHHQVPLSDQFLPITHIRTITSGEVSPHPVPCAQLWRSKCSQES